MVLKVDPAELRRNVAGSVQGGPALLGRTGALRGAVRVLRWGVRDRETSKPRRDGTERARSCWATGRGSGSHQKHRTGSARGMLAVVGTTVAIATRGACATTSPRLERYEATAKLATRQTHARRIPRPCGHETWRLRDDARARRGDRHERHGLLRRDPDRRRGAVRRDSSKDVYGAHGPMIGM